MFSGKEYPTITNPATIETDRFLDGASKEETLKFVQPAVKQNQENLKKAEAAAEKTQS